MAKLASGIFFCPRPNQSKLVHPTVAARIYRVWKDPEKNKTNQLHIVIIITQIRSLHLQHSSVVRENVILYNSTNQKTNLKRCLANVPRA